MPEASLSKVPWARLLLEAVAIIFSILIALAIESWWSGVQERDAEGQLLSRLHADFSENQERPREHIELHNRLVSGTEALLAVVSESEFGATEGIADTLVASVLPSPTFDPVTATLDAALSSGQIELIQSARIREALADWRGVWMDMREDELSVRDIVNRSVVPALDETRLTTPYREVVPWSLGDTAAAARLSGIRPVRISTELENALANQLFNARFVARGLSRLAEIQSSLLTSLEGG